MMKEAILALIPAELAWQPAQFNQFFSFMSAAALFAGFHFLMLEQRVKPWFQHTGLDENDITLAAGVLRKLVGGMILGVGSFVSLWIMGLNPLHFGVLMLDVERTLWAIVLPALLFVPIVALSMRSPSMWAFYPEIRTRRFTVKPACWSAFAWIVYLLGFEYFFRGFLLFYWVGEFGTWPALAMTTALYVLAHLPTNERETASTVPMGIVFGGLALYSGSFIAPFVLHVLIAVTSDLAAARFNPDIKT